MQEVPMAHIYELYKGFGTWVFKDLSADAGAPDAAGDPMGYQWDLSASSSPTNYYRATNGHIIELFIKSGGSWAFRDLSAEAGAPAAVGDPWGYVSDVPRVAFRGQNGSICELAVAPTGGTWGFTDLTAVTGAPAAAGDPMGYQLNVPRVVYRGQDGHIYELAKSRPARGCLFAWVPSSTSLTWGFTDLSAAAGAPDAAGDPMGYQSTDQLHQTMPRVVYRGNDGHIYELNNSGGWAVADLSAAGGAPAAQGDPMGYESNVPRVVYRGQQNGHIYELYFDGTWKLADLSAIAGSALWADGDPKGYKSDVPRVVFRVDTGSLGSQIWELALTGGTWAVTNLNATTPGALPGTGPMGYRANGSLVVYRGG